MPSIPKPQKLRYRPVPKLRHSILRTTFCGVDHSLSAADAPIHQYLGIKYASVPARFRHSKLCKSYPPLVDAACYGPICPQPIPLKSFEESILGLSEHEVTKQSFKHDEFECLNLNITAPAGLTPLSRVPVMLWVHGGGERGCGSSWVYDGGPLVRKSILLNRPVILVTFNFRIGLFGFAASPLLWEDNKTAGEESVGNYGLRDQRKAMEWLHNYIADFGGDPNNITVFGESTGGGDVLYHLLSSDNQTRPIFQRAIAQSPLLDVNLPNVNIAGLQMSRVLSALRISTIAQLRAVNTETLAAFGLTFRVVDDGLFLRSHWKDYFSAPSYSRYHRQLQDHISRARSRSSPRGINSPSRPLASTTLALPASLQPLIIGDCGCDSSLWSTSTSFWTPAAVVRRIKAVCQSLNMASNLMRVYDICVYTDEDEIRERVLDLVNDARVAWPTECVAQNAKRERGGRGVWRYVFDQEGPSRGVPHHGADIAYLFDSVPLSSCSQLSSESCCHGPLLDDSETELDCSNAQFDEGGVDDAWGTTVVDEWAYARIRDTMQERWIAFAYGEAPWREDKIFVFGPEGETGERSSCIFEGRRRKEAWKEVLEPLGMPLVQKVGMELSRGPSLGMKNC